MTAKEFKKAQQDLGLNNREMAEALKTSTRNIDNWRAGKVRVPGPVVVALYLLGNQTK